MHQIWSVDSEENNKLLPPDVILRLECTKFDLSWGSAPDPAEGAHGAPPDSLAEFQASYF